MDKEKTIIFECGETGLVFQTEATEAKDRVYGNIQVYKNKFPSLMSAMERWFSDNKKGFDDYHFEIKKDRGGKDIRVYYEYIKNNQSN